MDTCKSIEVIEATLLRRGDGKTETSPVRVITQYWTKDGQLLAEKDPAAVVLTPEWIEHLEARLRRTAGLVAEDVVAALHEVVEAVSK